MTLHLFKRPFDFDAIDADLKEDGFHHVVFILTGRGEELWRDALRDAAEMLEEYERRGADWLPVYKLVATLIQRAEVYENTAELLDEIIAALGLLPGTGLLEDIRMANLHKMDPHAWQRERNAKWIERYRAYRGI